MMREYLDRIDHELTELGRQPWPGDDELADIIGRLTAISRRVNDLKRGYMSEVSGPLVGADYKLTESRSASRSYNTAAILAAFDMQGYGLTELRKADAVRLSWRWTELKRAAYEAGVVMRIAPQEVSDDGDVEAPMIGETWQTDLRVEGK